MLGRYPSTAPVSVVGGVPQISLLTSGLGATDVRDGECIGFR